MVTVSFTNSQYTHNLVKYLRFEPKIVLRGCLYEGELVRLLGVGHLG